MQSMTHHDEYSRSNEFIAVVVAAVVAVAVAVAIAAAACTTC